jgi:hypothetical protein
VKVDVKAREPHLAMAANMDSEITEGDGGKDE